MDNEYSPEKIEQKWSKKWVENKTYAYREDRDAEVYSVDTPPPTVSGSLHFGHTYGNTLTDFQARFQRMNGKKVFFPFGYDNNGIASERLTEREQDIRHQDFSRREFQKKVRKVCSQYQDEFEGAMQEFAFSMDWDNTYTTIDKDVQEVSQLSFIDLYEDNREYREEAPAIWCPECETAISQVETEDSEKHAYFNDIEFPLASGNGSLMISTTRPELLPACVAIFVHPEDEVNNHLAGEKAVVPLFDREVPIIEDDSVDLETGTGVVMCCTFGDQNDIEWYKTHDLPLQVAIDESGTMTELAGDYESLSTDEAREEIVEDLDDNGFLLDREEITHTVQVHERCEHDIEFLVTEQWYVKVLDNKEEYLEAGREMDWHPEKMFTRYKHWVEGLQWDWCISRQRDSGIPFPVWYCVECDEEVIADREQLPVDPIADEPPVEKCSECGCEEFEPEKDVFDTWATSSLTPLINAGWHWSDSENEFMFENPELYPMTLRPQGHDIISFWLFHTVVKCYEHTGEVPFDSVMINGHVLDENREKMSKSKGNVTTPDEVLEEYPVDAARYWAGQAKVGEDLALKDKDLVSGEKLLRKLWNASNLVDQLVTVDQLEVSEDELEEIDKWIIAEVDETVEKVTEAFKKYDFQEARDTARHDFWHTFCDNYLEIAKQRLEDNENRSAMYALKNVHRKFLKMFAPITPHITEEIWQDMYSEKTIHRSSWPEPSRVDGNLEAGENAMEVISALRKYKTSNQMSLNETLEKVQVYGDITGFEDAIEEVMHVEELEKLEEEPETEKQIVEIKLDYSKAGPEYGDQVSEIEEALEENEWNFESGHLHVADHMLKPEMFEVKEEVKYTGEGEMIETENTMVVIR